MQWSVVFLSFIIYNVEILCENRTDYNSRNNLSFIGYIHGYKTDQDIKYHGFLVSPVIVIPSLNRDVKTQKNGNDIKAPNGSAILGKILLNDDNDIEVNFRQALETRSGNKTGAIEESLNQTVLNNENIATDTTNGTNTALVSSITSENDEITTTSDMTSEAHGPYRNAVYNNKAIYLLKITNGSDEILQPPLTDEQWKNFTVSTNIDVKENITKEEPSVSVNITKYPSENESDSPMNGVYPAAKYNNAEIDQLSITTNSYTNRSPLPPPQDDRWSNSGSLRKNLPTSNEFRPLAGLYYDGFFDRPILKTQGFVPYDHYPLKPLL